MQKSKASRDSYYPIRKKQILSENLTQKIKMSLHINKGSNPARRYNISKNICTEHQYNQIHETIIFEPKGTDRTSYNNSRSAQHPNLINRRISRLKLAKIS
jgi:hypothetical protein